MRDTNKAVYLFLIVIFICYVLLRAIINLPALNKPRELADTTAYLRISNQPLLSADFWGSSRPLGFPLLLKIAHQNDQVTATLQLGFSILVWGLLAFAVAASLRPLWLQPLVFVLILALSLVRQLAGWDFVMMTESLSVSWFVLFLAVGVWLLHGWRIYKVILLCVIAFFLAFTRDTNAYLLLMLAGLILLAVLLRWMQPRSLILAAFFIFIFLLNNADASLGGRWIFPLINLIGRRVLPNQQAVKFFESCGMPVSPELMGLKGEFANGDDRAFYNDPALESFRTWLNEHGKTCYMRWLVTNPVDSISSSWNEFQNLIAFDNVDNGNYFSRAYDPVLPWRVERVLYPDQLILWIWGFVTAAALIAVFSRAWHWNPLWAAFILLCLPIFPHLFISWHGDAMAPQRHALSVGLELMLSFWMLIFLLLDTVQRLLSKNEI